MKFPPTRLEILKLAQREVAPEAMVQTTGVPQSTAPSRVSGNDATQQGDRSQRSSLARTGTDRPPKWLHVPLRKQPR
jgi:hypothetical protein